MQPANESTVLGDFNNASLTQYGVTSSFYKKNGKFLVRAEGADGKLHDYQIKYTFGVDPLQQYLIEFPGGRLQALSLAWDARPKKQGGQRWFHLYPDEKIAHDDELHWTGVNQNWNGMCAECHSTNLEKNYDAATRTFSTSWSEIDVACEACHGPGADHVTWAERKPGWEELKKDYGLLIRLDERKGVAWTINQKTGNAARSKARSTSKEIDMCARCHARRSPISAGYKHDEAFLDHYLPRRLDEGIYYADGQINDEVYVYGSFVQSKMYGAGVTCSDCHEPHSLNLRIPGNGVCLQCHQAKKYDQTSHHFHNEKSAGASCAECHMPPKTYMVVDPRHDHSMRVPRPDLSVKFGTPNACNNCHTDKDANWAAKQVKAWYGNIPEGFQTYAQALNAARQGEAQAGNALLRLVQDVDAPGIARATAVAHISPYLNTNTIEALPFALSDEDPMVRAGALSVLDQISTDLKVKFAFPLVNDPVRAVRIEAGRVLMSIPAGDLSKDLMVSLDNAIQEYVTSQKVNADRPEAQTNLGNYYAAQDHPEKAITAYKTALELNPAYVPAYINLADFYRTQGSEAQAFEILTKAVNILPNNGAIHHATGLSLVRQKRVDDAIKEFRQASALNPENARYAYVYGVALNSSGKMEDAISVLEKAYKDHPNNQNIVNALIVIYRDSGNMVAARRYAEKLQRMSP
jgi:tetratricopeptide (TPR) repeat protein